MSYRQISFTTKVASIVLDCKGGYYAPNDFELLDVCHRGESIHELLPERTLQCIEQDGLAQAYEDWVCCREAAAAA